MEELEIRQLTLSDKEAHADFIEEMMAVDGEIIPSSAMIKDHDSSFEHWLERKNNEASGINIPAGRVPATLFFLIRKNDGKILGAVHIRHKLNEALLRHGGNIGYGVRPSERRKGYADKMLKFALQFCKSLGLNKALITCDKANLGSAKTIIKNGGVFEDEFFDEGKVTQRYWIELK